MKMIKIKNCLGSCPYLYNGPPQCGKNGQYFKKEDYVILNNENFPDWCPLEDYDETLEDRRPLFSENK